MNFFYQFAIMCLVVSCGQAAHNCTSFNDKNHGYGCELKNVTSDREVFEINVMAKDDTNKTETDVTWVQIRDSDFDNKLPKGIFEKFDNMEKMMILSSTGFKTFDMNYFDKKIKLVLMKNTDLEVIGENAFVGLSELKILSLNYNKIQKVHKNAFRDLVSMEKIEMVWNQIQSLDDDVFANNINLKLVLLYNNQIKVVSAQLFSRNVNMESLQLQSNAISQIEKGFYTNLRSLTRADFSSNVCISESILLTRYLQWSSHQYKFKDCYNNYALMKSTNDYMGSLEKKLDTLDANVKVAVETMDNDMKVLEGKLTNQTEFEDLRTNLLDFFKTDKETLKETFKTDLNNITSHVRTEMISEIEKKVESALSKTQEAQQEKLVSNDFETLRDDFSGKFTLIYCALFFLLCLVFATTFFVFQKHRIFPTISYKSDNRQLIESEVY